MLLVALVLEMELQQYHQLEPLAQVVQCVHLQLADHLHEFQQLVHQCGFHYRDFLRYEFQLHEYLLHDQHCDLQMLQVLLV